jgi:hypothetical protein
MKKFLLGVLLLTGCASAEMAGYYEGVLPAASGGAERLVGVTLKPDGTAVVTSAFAGRPSRLLVRGAWDNDGDQVTIELPALPPEHMVFEYRKGRLVAKEWERSTWGEAGPGTLERQ